MRHEAKQLSEAEAWHRQKGWSGDQVSKYYMGYDDLGGVKHGMNFHAPSWGRFPMEVIDKLLYSFLLIEHIHVIKVAPTHY